MASILLSPSSPIPLQIVLAFAALSVIFSSSRIRFIFCLDRPNDSAMSVLDRPCLEFALTNSLPLFLIRGQGHEMFVSAKTSFQLFERGMDASNSTSCVGQRMGDIP